MMIDKKQIEQLIEQATENTMLFITSVQIKPGNNILVFLDGDHGVSIEDCVRISRFIENNLDREKEDFSLNVSSHGLTSPFVMPRQYRNHCGKEVTILFKDGNKISAVITEADDLCFSVLPMKKKKKSTSEQTDEVQKIQYSEIKEVKLNISF